MSTDPEMDVTLLQRLSRVMRNNVSKITYLGNRWVTVTDKNKPIGVSHLCSDFMLSNTIIIPGVHKICPACEAPVPPEIEILAKLEAYSGNK